MIFTCCICYRLLIFPRWLHTGREGCYKNQHCTYHLYQPLMIAQYNLECLHLCTSDVLNIVSSPKTQTQVWNPNPVLKPRLFKEKGWKIITGGVWKLLFFSTYTFKPKCSFFLWSEYPWLYTNLQQKQLVMCVCENVPYTIYCDNIKNCNLAYSILKFHHHHLHLKEKLVLFCAKMQICLTGQLTVACVYCKY